MFVALDANCNKVDIEDADPEQIYYCPLCKEPLIQHRGKIVAHHFVHQKDTSCPCSTNPTSPWHRDWQKNWPVKAREVYFFNGKEYRISDIAVGDLTVEFQKSPMLLPKIEARTDFYRNLDDPRQVLWVFDRSKYSIQEVIHYWATGESYRPSGYFSAPKAFWVDGAIKDKWEMMAFDYSYAVVVLTNWLTKDELDCDVVGVADGDGILNIAKDILILGKDELVKLIDDRARVGKDGWSFEKYVKENALDILVSGINALSDGNIHADFKNAINDAKRVYGQYVFSSVSPWNEKNTYTFLKGNLEDFDVDASNLSSFATNDLFLASLAKSRGAFEDMRKEVLSSDPLPREFSVASTLDIRKADVSIIFFYLLQKLGLQFSPISKQNALAMLSPKPLEKNLAIIAKAEERRKQLAQQKAEAEARALEEKRRQEKERRRKEALERQAREIAKAREEAKRLAEAEAKRPFEPSYFLTDLRKFRGLSPQQKRVANTFSVSNIPIFYSWRPPRPVQEEWESSWMEIFDESCQDAEIDIKNSEISVGNICLTFNSRYVDVPVIRGKKETARKDKKVLWRVFNATSRSLADILAINGDGRICPYFVLNVEDFDAAQIDKKTDVVVLDYGPFCCLLTGWQPIWKVLQGATGQDSLGFTGADFTKYIAPFARTSLPESVQRGFDDTSKRGNMAAYAFFFKKADLVSFLTSSKYTMIEKRNLKKFYAKHEDEVRENLKTIFSKKYSDEYLDEIFVLEGKIVGEMSSNSYYSSAHVYLELDVDEDTGLFEASWTLDMKDAFAATSPDILDSVFSDSEQKRKAASFGDVRSLEAYQVDLMKITHYLVSSLVVEERGDS